MSLSFYDDDDFWGPASAVGCRRGERKWEFRCKGGDPCKQTGRGCHLAGFALFKVGSREEGEAAMAALSGKHKLEVRGGEEKVGGSCLAVCFGFFVFSYNRITTIVVAMAMGMSRTRRSPCVPLYVFVHGYVLKALFWSIDWFALVQRESYMPFMFEHCCIVAKKSIRNRIENILTCFVMW